MSLNVQAGKGMNVQRLRHNRMREISVFQVADLQEEQNAKHCPRTKTQDLYTTPVSHGHAGGQLCGLISQPNGIVAYILQDFLLYDCTLHRVLQDRGWYVV